MSTNEAQRTPGALSDHATRVASKVFAKRGSHSEAHVSEIELAVIVEAAITTDPVRSDLLAACEAAEQIESLRDFLSENYGRLNSRQGTAESMALSRKNIEETKERMRAIRSQLRSAIAAARGRS